MSNSIMAQIRGIMQDPTATAQFANIGDLAYHLSQGGKEEDYKPFGLDQPEKIGISAAGLYATIEAVGYYAMVVGKSNDEGYRTGLQYFAQLGDKLPEEVGGRQMVLTAMRFAHATWMASQPFRDMATKPLGRLGRDVVNVFDALPLDQQAKDLRQIRKAAQWLCDKFEIAYTAR